MKLRYELEDKLGQGGMGVVYRARQVDLDRKVAIKYLLDNDGSDSSQARFKREMDALISLNHPNIVKVFDAGVHDGKLFYVMELLCAKDLAEVLKGCGALPPWAAVAVLDQMLDALEYVHGRGLIHRDIKPSNIMLEAGGRAILMDFGLVRKVDGTMLTAEGSLLGTPRYYPPEYIRGEPASPAGDLWSLGVCAFEMLCGEKPFTAPAMQELVVEILQKPVPPLRELRPELDGKLVALVERMLMKEPQDRFASAAEVRTVLRSLGRADGRTRLPTGRTRVPPAPSRPAAPASTPARSVAWPAVLALGGVLAVLIAWTRAGPERGAPPSPSPVAATSVVGPVRAEYEAADRLVVSFRTRDASRWSLDGGHGTVTEKSPLTTHAIALAADPVRPPPRLVLTAPGQRIEVSPPAPPMDRVRALLTGLKALKVDEKKTDALFTAMFPALSGDGLTPGGARAAAASDPAVLPRLTSFVTELSTDARIEPHLQPLLACASSLLASERISEAQREELLDVLFRLDLVDSLAEYAGQPPVFRIQARLAPAVEISAADEGTSAPALPRGLRALYAPASGKGTCIYPTIEDFSGKQLAAGFVNVADPAISGRDSGRRKKFLDPAPAGPNGRVLHLWVYGLSPQSYVYVTADGGRSGVPLRLRGPFHGPDRTTRFRVALKGPLAGIDRFRVTVRHMCLRGKRMFFALDGVAAESP